VPVSFLYEIDFLDKGKIDVLIIKRMGEKFVVNITVLESACANDSNDQVRINGANFSGFWSKEIFILI
jgi:hypothetical protein